MFFICKVKFLTSMKQEEFTDYRHIANAGDVFLDPEPVTEYPSATNIILVLLLEVVVVRFSKY